MLGSREWLLTLGIFLLALVLRLYRLDVVPPGLNGDEIYNIIDARQIGWGNWPIFMPGNNGREALYFYFLALSLRLFGESVVALRLPSVLLGSGCAVLAYLLGRDLFNRRVGLVAGVLVAVSLWPLMPSRIGLRAISLTFFTALTIYLYLRGLRSERRWPLVLAGFALGLTLYTYIPSRVFPLVLLGWLLGIWLCQRQMLAGNGRHLLLSLLLALLLIAPFGVYMVRYPEQVNQRVHSMTSALERAQQGEQEALLRSAAATLGMFSIRGDGEWRYHVAGRPVFDPFTSVLFYTGIALALLRLLRPSPDQEQRAHYLLVFLWLGAMVAPNAVLNENPSFLRAAGAIVPAYLFVGLGFDVVFGFVQGRWPRARVVMAAAGLLLGAFTLGSTWNAYFGIWANHPETRSAYNAQEAAIGRYLARQPPANGERVFVASGYAYDSTTVVGLSYYSDSRVAWFSRSETLPWSESGVAARYLIPANNDLPQVALQRLQDLSRPEQVRFADGSLAFTVYTVFSGDAFEWSPEQAVDMVFERGPRLVGYDAPESVYAGQELPLTLHWEITADEALPNQLSYVQIYLKDAGGATRAREEVLLGYPQAGWQGGDRFIQTVTLQVPEGVLAGPASLAFGLRDNEGQPYDLIAGEAENVAGPLLRTRPLEQFAVTPDMPIFDGTLALRQATFRPLLTPGATLNLALDWVALEQPPADYRVQLQLVTDEQDEPLLSQTYEMWPETHPPSEWQALEAVTTFHGLRVPREIDTSTEPELVVRLLPADDLGALPLTQGTGVLGKLGWHVREHLFMAPAMDHAVNARFGNVIELVGYELNVADARPGGSVTLTLVWQALRGMDENYTVFNHLVDSNGHLAGQFDGPPQGEAWLTNTWLPGEVVVEERTIPIENSTQPGQLSLVVGLYESETIERLPVWVVGEQSADDQVTLTEIEVQAE